MKKPSRLGESLAAAFSSRSFRVGGVSVLSAALVVALAVAANVLVRALPAKYTQLDTTASRLYTLSAQTETVLDNLSEDVDVYWVVRDGREENTLETLLNRYGALSPHLHVSKLDPEEYPAFVEPYSATARDNSLLLLAGERSRYVDYYDIYDYSAYASIGAYEVTFAGESALTSAIAYVTSDALPKVYLLTGHGESPLSVGFEDAVERENIALESLSLLTVSAVPADADAVFVNAPQSDISGQEAEILLAYLKSGGSLLLLTDPPQGEALHNLEALMALYGVAAAEGIVVETDSNNYTWDTPYYLLPNIAHHAITNPLLSAGYRVLLPVAQGLTVGERPSTATATALLSTSDGAFSKRAGWRLATYSREAGDTDGPFALAVAIEDETGAGTARIVWVSCTSLVDESVDQLVSGGNGDFFLNALGWLCQGDESAVTVRPKSLSREYLTMPGSVSTALAVLVVGVVPLVYLAVGLVVWARRRRR